MTSSKRLDSLDALRAISCLGIFGFHLYFFSTLGHLFVSVFFVVSGFLMVYAYSDRLDTSELTVKGCIAFSLKKIKKLYPLHILMMIIPVAEQFYGLLNGLIPPSFDFFGHIAAQLLLVQSWIPDVDYYFALNGVSWYLSVSLFLYAVFPLILRAIRRYTKPSHGLIGAAAIYAVQLAAAWVHFRLADGSQWFLQVFPLFRLGDFAIGCNIGYYFLCSEEKRRPTWLASIYELTAIAAMILAEVFSIHIHIPRFMRYSLVYIPFAVMLVFAFAYGKGIPVRLLTNRAAKYIASISAYVFLIHYVAINVSGIVFDKLVLPQQLVKPAYVFCAVALTFAASELYRRFSQRKKILRTKG